MTKKILKKRSEILHPNSPLHFLPEEIEDRQLMIFDSLRFTAQMIDYNFNELIRSLEQISSNEKAIEKHIIFNHSWTLIDHAQRFCLLYKKLNISEDSIIHKLDYITKFRNAIQHVNKNLDEKILPNNRPIYGIIKWVVNDPEKPEIFTSLCISGIFNKGQLQFRHHAKSGYEYYVNNIILETETLKKKDENEINLDELIADLREVIQKIDLSIFKLIKEQGIKLADWKSRKDIIMNMKNEA